MRYGLDILMLVLLVGEMAFFYLPPLVHEAVGVAFLLPIAWHLALNRRYVSSLGSGRWNEPRALWCLLNILLAGACLLIVISGCLTSSELFADVVPFSLRSNPLLYQVGAQHGGSLLPRAGGTPSRSALEGLVAEMVARCRHPLAAIACKDAPIGVRYAARGSRCLCGPSGSARRAPAGRTYLHDAGTFI